LRGRSGRQGDPGTSQFFVSLEDNLMRLFGSDRIAKLMDRMGLQEGEVIQHSLITKSIERAQKKVEENNFAIRKRLLEYDNVMNSQREVIYKRRKNALFGERLHLDILNAIYDLSENIFSNTQAKDNFDNFKLAVIKTFGFNTIISENDFNRTKANDLTLKLYNEAVRYYYEKMKKITEKTLPVLREIFNTRGATVENVIIPFTDGAKQIGVTVTLKKAVAANAPELRNSMEKLVSLMFIDNSWKEHLRNMDDLKQQVHNAVFEQKDPLLVYKFEAFKLFQQFLAKVNQDIVSFLFKAELQTNEPDKVQEAKEIKHPKQKLSLKKDEVKSLLSSSTLPNNASKLPSKDEKNMPIKSQKIANRNDRVSVQYTNGEIKKDVKFKTVEDDIKNNKCVIID
jgi:preprotein translocase subunit SecA